MRAKTGIRTALAAGMVVILGACASGGGGEGEQVERRPPLVRVENDNWAQVNVYATRAGHSVRLGTVPSAGRATFALPSTMEHAMDVRLVVEPLASRVDYVSPALTWGADVKLTIANQLSLSTLVPLRELE